MMFLLWKIAAWLTILACVVVSTMALVITGSVAEETMDGESGSASAGRLRKIRYTRGLRRLILDNGFGKRWHVFVRRVIEVDMRTAADFMLWRWGDGFKRRSCP